jgi:hypothetical protein
MSASPATDACPDCGAETPLRARYCPDCGRPLGEPADRTIKAEVPREETGPVPVSMQVAEPHWFGVTPPHLLLGVAVGAFVLAIVLFALGHWPYGLILLGLAALVLAAFTEAARRRPNRSEASRAGSSVVERTRSALEELRARSEATVEARRIQNGLVMIASERREALTALGAAAHARDSAAEAGARATLVELDEREAALTAELEERLATAGERIRQAKLPVQDTMMVLPTEPSPPPDEGTPPQPARVPEPYPPPDEGDPPQPAIVPEPSPDNPRED